MLSKATSLRKPNVVIENASQVPLFLNLVQEILSTTFCSPSDAQWQLADIARATTENFKYLFDYYMSPFLPITHPVRSKALIAIVTLAASSRSALGDTPIFTCRLLRYRLVAPSSPGWELVDDFLLKLCSDKGLRSPPKSDLLDLLSVVADEKWIPASETIRVCSAIHFFCIVSPRPM